jgi:hypothetical protein
MTFTVAPVYAGSADTFTYSWSVTKNGNPYALGGVTTNTSSLTFTPSDNGNFVATVVVTDDDNDTVSASSSTVVVGNVAPTATITGVNSGVAAEGSTIALGSTTADVGTADTLSYAWSVTKNGQPYDLSGVTTNASSIIFDVNDNGAFVVTLVVTDDDGGSITKTKNITVTNANPDAEISGEPVGSISEGTPVSLSVLATDPGTLDTFTYTWSVKKNGSAYTLPGNAVVDQTTFTFTPNDNGTYVAYCRVVDNNSGEFTASSDSIAVSNVAPGATITGTPSGSVHEGDTISLGSTVTDVSTVDTFTYSWSVTKGGNPFTLPGDAVTNATTFSFVPTDNGTYVATLVVTDDDNGSVSVSTTDITVLNSAPTANISSPTTGVEGSDLTFTVTPSDAGSADVLTYSWTVTKGGNPYSLGGVTTNAASLTFAPNDNGNYVATCVVTDDDGDSVSVSSSTVVVSNAAPTATITGVNSGLAVEGSTISLGSTHGDAGSADTLTYAWSATKDGEAYDLSGVTTDASTITFDVNDNGAFVVTLVVTDDDGGSVTKTKSINVTNANPDVDITVYPSGGVNEGDEAHYETSATDASTQDTISYAWTVTRNNVPYVLPNNVVTTNSDFTFTPTLPGTYRVEVSATDDDSGTSGEYHQLVVSNVAPIISALTGPSGDVNRNSAVNYTATITDPGAETFTYEWTVRLDGEVVTTSTSEELSFTPADPGEYEVSLIVSDGISDSDAYTTNLDVINHAPVIDSIESITEAIEGDSATISADASDEDDDSLLYTWVVTLGETVVLESDASEIDLDFVQDGTYEVSLTISDGITSDSESSTITVANAAPVITSATATGTLIEGGNVTLAGVATDAGADDEVAFSWSVRRAGSETVLATSDDASFVFTPTDDGDYIAVLIVTDGSDTDEQSVEFTAANSLPTGTLVVPTYAGVRGWDQTFSIGNFAKYSGDAVTVDWNFGGETVTGASPSAAQTRRWYTNGTYTITATLKDNDGGQTVLTQSFEVRDYGIQPDPMGDGLALAVVGTSDNDVIAFSKLSNGKIRAFRNGVQLGNSFGVDRIYAYGDSGSNNISAASNITIPVIFTGGSSKDTLIGGGGDDLLVGRRGIDYLVGGNGRDILVGGTENDNLNGGEGEDLLIASSFGTAENLADMAIVTSEWSNTSRNFATRVSRLRNGASGLFAFLGTGSVIKDSKIDQLTGGNGSDWIFKDVEGINSDSVLAATSGDTITNVS